jgi:LacI family sucrose operon transcriptional repressor
MNITEIAKLAGVSKAAVSRYFNNGYLSGEKRAAVERVVTETGYAPNVQAQMLRTQKNRQIGVVLPKLSSESVARVVDGISAVLAENGYQLMLASTANDPAKEVESLDMLRHHHVEGMIFLASIFTPDHDRILRNLHAPVVIVGQQYNGCSCVYHDDRGAAAALTELMLRRGCRRPGYIGVTRRDRAAGQERCQGFLSAVRAAGLEVRERDMAEAAFTMESGYERAAELLGREDRPDGLFCATDNIAAGAMQYCREHGLQVPRDVMLTGVGDSPLGRVSAVTLTSAHLYYRTSGEEAARLLLSQLRRHGPGADRSLRLGFEVVERDSTRRTETPPL